MAAARQFQVELGVDAVDVRLICQKAASSFGELQLARAWYRPSREGWRDLSAAPRGFSDQELEYLRLWAELRGRFQTADGLTVVDFKTDRVTAEEAPRRAEVYRTQLNAYAGALAKILQKPVTERVLYFFACDREISL